MKKKITNKKESPWFESDWLEDMNDLEKFKSKYGYYPNEKKTKDSLEFYKQNFWMDNPYKKQPRPKSLDNQIKDIKETIASFSHFVNDMKKELKKLQSKKQEGK